MYPERVVSGMLPTHSLHLGHYEGVLKHWVKLQAEMPCLFFVADWHALAFHAEDPQMVEKASWEMVLDWLAVGIDPSQTTLFIQSRVPEHAELHLLLSMATPLAWLEKQSTYQTYLSNLAAKDQASYGMLGGALLQAADILIYRASQVPMPESQTPNLEIICDIAQRFNHLYGKEKDFEEKAQNAVKKLGSKRAKLYSELRAQFQQEGKEDALEQAKAVLDEAQNLSMSDRERLFGYLEGSRKLILVEPEPLILPPQAVPGLDGRQMRFAAANTLGLREDPAQVIRKINQMPTDPARTERTVAGDPNQCPVWPLHQLYSEAAICERLMNGCTRAAIDCGECKQQLSAAIIKQQEPNHERVQQYLDDPSLVRAIIADGCDNARKLAQETMRDVREAIGLAYSI